MLKLVKPLNQQAPAYADAVGACCELLDSVIDRLRDHAVWFAVTGVWREWADAQPTETTAEFTQEMLADSGDPNILSLLRLSQELATTRDLLRASIA